MELGEVAFMTLWICFDIGMNADDSSEFVEIWHLSTVAVTV